MRFSFLILFAITIAAAAPLPLRQTSYRMRAGDPAILEAPAETVSFVRESIARSVVPQRFVLVPSGDGNSLLLSAPLTTPPGRYSVTISATRADGVQLEATLSVILDPVKTVPSNATKPPVILLNGFDLGSLSGNCQPSNTSPHSASTFGGLEAQLLNDGVPVVYFFDNCVEAPGAKIEDLGNALGQFLALIKDETGALVPKIDMVGHSMGGLIVRSYLAGLQADGSLSPPLDPRVRKLITIATPHFGSYIAAEFASLLNAQGAEMIPGSPFLWNLSRWNQFTDDLRGVDAIAIIGNAGQTTGSTLNASDGVVSLTSASLNYTRDSSRTRILPYCHTSGLAIVGCSAPPIANVDTAPETKAIIRSFLSGASDWQLTGGTPNGDPYLSQDGGVYFAVENTAGTQYLNDLSQVQWGTTPLQNVNGNFVYYNELAKIGTNGFTASSTSAGKLSCPPVTVPAGWTSTYRCKSGAAITSVGPLVTNVATGSKLVQPGGAITISGSGFGQRCPLCSLTVKPVNVLLSISSWSDNTITAQLPPTLSGVAQMTLAASNSGDSINFMIAPVGGPTAVNLLTNAASGTSIPIAPGEMITLKGAGLGPAAGQSFSLNQSTHTVDTTLAGTRVFIGGIAAPITYASATQVNAIVPYEIAGMTQVSVFVQYQGTSSQPLTANIMSAAPGIFTFNFTGSGQAVAANQDGSLNGPAGSGPNRPAPKGSYLTIYWTGGGQTVPVGTTGSVNSLTTLKQFSNVSATVGGQPVTVTFAGAAPGLVDGVCQLNIQLPANIASGDALPLVITVNGVQSAATATLAVQ